jgi:hypothetical protein
MEGSPEATMVVKNATITQVSLSPLLYTQSHANANHSKTLPGVQLRTVKSKLDEKRAGELIA